MSTGPVGEARSLSCVANFRRVGAFESTHRSSYGEINLEGKTPKADLGRNKLSRSRGEQCVERVRNPEDAA